MRRLALILLLALPGAVIAQDFSLITGREPVTSLDGLWRFHTGDNPAWASPSFDDSQWPLLRSDESWDAQGYSGYSGYAWYRFTVQVPDGSRPWALFLPAILIGYQVFADGKLIGGEGSIGPTRNPVIADFPVVYRLPSGSPGPQSIQIAIRVWHLTGMGIEGGMQQAGSIAGSPAVLARRLSLDRKANTVDVVGGYGYCLLATLVGLTTLVLFFSRPEDREYLWFSITLLASGAQAAFAIVGNYASIPLTTYHAVAAVAQEASVIAALFFFSIVLTTPRSFLWRIACVGAALSPIGLLFYYLQWTSWGEGHAVGTALMLPADIWFVATLGRSIARKDVSARWLLIPPVLYYGINLLGHLSWASFQLGWVRVRVPYNIALISRPFPISLSDIFGYLFVLSLLIFLVRRFSAARQEEARLSQEMEAARSVQTILVPAVPPLTPGFAIESVYLPAQEVGGDFFQIVPHNDGSLLLVIGDVSGKGLRPAMTVSAIMGALRGCMLRTPAEVLAYLNRVLYGQVSGFVTCCVALIGADGGLIVANAGHLSPYINGKELPVDAGLPLGIADGTAYAETAYQLSPNDRLTFLSDGVVEARNATGELFGFDRTAAISSQSAEAIAAAAQTHGQEDDITVLTLAFAPAEVLHA